VVRQVKVSILSAITHKAAGESHSQCKHKDSTVAEVRRLHKEGMSRGEIARRTGVPYQTLMDWLNGRSRVVPKIKKTTTVVLSDKVESAPDGAAVRVSTVVATTGRQAGALHNKATHSDVDVARVRQLFADGLTRAEIVRRTGIPHDTVTTWVRGQFRKQPSLVKTTIVETEAYGI
jgi:DNA-binding transcriptional regulator YiaG